MRPRSGRLQGSFACTDPGCHTERDCHTEQSEGPLRRQKRCDPSTSGTPAQGSGGYGLNLKQPHSAMIAGETEALVIYAGEPDRIESMELVDI